MKEFQWKVVHTSTNSIIQHINRYVILLTMIKANCANTAKLEEEANSLNVQDFSVYEEFFFKYLSEKELTFKGKKKLLKYKDDLLQNQPPFKTIIEKMQSNKPFNLTLSEKKDIFKKFSQYVNLKDLRTVHKCSSFLIYGIVSLIFLFLLFTAKRIPSELLILNFLEIIVSGFALWTFKGKSKTYILNSLRINTDLCLVELQKTLETVEKELNVHSDPYYDFEYDETLKIFLHKFNVSKDFLKICRDEGIIDEQKIVKAEYNHFLIQYLKSVRKEGDKDKKFDWQLIDHVIHFDLIKTRKSYFLKNDFKFDDGEYYSAEGKKYGSFIKNFEKS
ncbi:MAG: hypothetical protein K6E69_06100 [Treponema sp.]|uniref:hypothetical protein n=1 Tax=Treponema sp. TaxID=166 RepID=UPI00298E90A4|nr:hypothetical protein [Treponema sp.]MCR5386672.1 hypothetical protein [Treponema sp.]